ncbi:2-amino-4-hydroxy-6-hydroxymethyldihydropteridine diphosphokinase [Radiobacillus sp. PE A8.2]|uniref:2-amino-4-hydroxy-6- hydroxymethyldihydropteridine diphosphokinase n=1 Tax=Radiobacillus sp. PE A8.2 TaxID=3380349 RepID=UPI00388D6D0F
MNVAYIGLGSNIAPRFATLMDAVKIIGESPAITVTAKSSIYETKPVGFVDQDNFLNMVLELKTTLNPSELLGRCLQIELQLGRKREIKWGPRTIDLDILLYNQDNIKTERLIVPHPRMHERAFVLIPLSEINPNLFVPTNDKCVKDILDEVPAQEKKGVNVWVPTNGEEE